MQLVGKKIKRVFTSAEINQNMVKFSIFCAVSQLKHKSDEKNMI